MHLLWLKGSEYVEHFNYIYITVSTLQNMDGEWPRSDMLRLSRMRIGWHVESYETKFIFEFEEGFIFSNIPPKTFQMIKHHVKIDDL